ncbi:MAG: TonB-dependent receptor plug domain-containing protein, partial [Spirochaetota bacterium]
FLYFTIPICIYSQAQQSVFLRKVAPYASERDAALEQQISDQLQKNITQFTLEKEQLSDQTFVYIDIFYKTYDKYPPDLYAQIYDPQTKEMIDAISSTTDFELIRDIELDSNEFSNEERLDEFTKKLDVTLQVNPNKEKLTYNLLDHFINKPIAKNPDIAIKEIDTKAEARKIFTVLEEDKVVTASRKKQTISDSPAKVIVISGQKIEERGYRTLTEVLQDVIGFDFNSFHDPGEYTTDLLLRGIGDVGQTQVLIMEDGVVQNDIGNGWMRHVRHDIAMLDIERIEIILGPGSALYGANAYAGLINIITKKGKNLFRNGKGKKVYWKSNLDLGSFRSKMVESLFAYRTNNNIIFRLTGRYYDTPGDGGLHRPDPGNYFRNNYEPDLVTTNNYGTRNGSFPAVPNDRLPGNARIPLRDGFDTSKENFFLRGAIEKDDFTLGYTLWQLKEGLGSYVPGYEYFSNTPGIPFQKKHNGYYVNMNYYFELSRHFTSSVKLYTRNTTIHPETEFVYTYRFQSVLQPQIDGVFLPPIPDKSKSYHSQSYLSGLQEQFNYKLTDSNDLVFGYQLDRVKRAASGDQLGGIALGRTQSTRSTIIERRWNTQDEQQAVAATFYSTNAAIYIQDEQKFWQNRYSLTIGLRRDYDTDYGNVITTRSGFIGKPLDWLQFKLLFGEAFKAPTVFQLYDEFRGNEFLKPQKIRTYESEMSLLPIKRMSVKFGYFFSQLTGLIQEARNPNDGTYLVGVDSQKATYFQNLAPTHIYGTSLEFEYKWKQNISSYINYTFTGDRDRKTAFEVESDPVTGAINDITPVYDGHEIDNIAARKLNVGVNYRFLESFHANLRVNWVGRRKAPITNTYYQPYDYSYTRYAYVTEGTPDGYLSSYSLINLSLGYKNMFGIDGLSSMLVVRNLADKDYVGMGRQSGNARRPINSLQPQIQNPDGFVSPYHPQPGRTFYFRISYQL